MLFEQGEVRVSNFSVAQMKLFRRVRDLDEPAGLRLSRRTKSINNSRKAEHRDAD